MTLFDWADKHWFVALVVVLVALEVAARIIEALAAAFKARAVTINLTGAVVDADQPPTGRPS